MSTDESQLRLTPGISKPIKTPSPTFQLIILASLIFLAEIVAMVIIYFVDTPHYLAETLLDALIMLALLMPGLYYLQLKPLLNQIRERTRVEQALRNSEELFRTTVDTLPVGLWLADPSGKIIYTNPAGKAIWAGTRHIGVDQFGEYKGWWLDSGRPIEPDEWGIARAIRKEEISLNEEIEIECFDGMHKIILNSAFPLYDDQKKISGAFVINQDITDQKRAAKQLFEQNEELKKITMAEKKQRQLAETLAQSIVALNSSLELEHVINTLLEYINLIVPSNTAVVHLFEDESRPEVRILRGYGKWENRTDLGSIPIDGITDSLIQRLAATRKSIIIPNLELSVTQEDAESGESIHNWLAIPIIAGDKVAGLVELGRTGAITFDEEDSRGVEALVSQAAIVIHNAWLFEEVRASNDRLQALTRKLVEVQESERYHIARELHDEAGQALSSLKISLSRLEQDPDCPSTFGNRLGELKFLADEVLDELRRMAMDLRPAALDHLGLAAALEQYTRNLNSETFNIQFKTIGFEGERLAKDIAIPLYRIVQEALTNVVRHASACNVGILLERGNGVVRVFVEDDGVGMAPGQAENNHRMGLVGMRERAEMLGGNLTVESSPGEGTSIIVEVPLGNSGSHS